MKTTQRNALNAFSVIAVMARKPMNSTAAYKLFKLKKALSEIVEFQAEQEKKLVGEHGGSITETGRVSFNDKAKEEEYTKAYRELQGLECDVPVERLTMRLVDVPEITIAEIESLDPFIEWKE